MAGYREEPGVDPLSRTETYAAMRLDVDNWRWAGRAVLRAHRQAAAEAGSPRWRCSSSARRTCRSRPTSSPSCEPDALILRIQPDEGITLRFGAKVPGPLLPGPLGVAWSSRTTRRSARSRPEAYERLLLDALIGDPTLFIRSDEVEQCWRIVDPIIEHWATDQADPDVRGGVLGSGRGRPAAGA